MLIDLTQGFGQGLDQNLLMGSFEYKLQHFLSQILANYDLTNIIDFDHCVSWSHVFSAERKWKLKADRPPPRDYPHMPPDYRHTDKTLGLVTTTLYSKFEGNCLLLHSASRAPNIDRYAPDIWPWPLTLMPTFDLDPNLDLKARLKATNSEVIIRFWAFDLDLWPTTLTYIPSLA